ncbi:MAG: nicotinate phosphoribosyltransferase [candidate division KSB1 bacterium]|nr:nicotinate phosphoribosyltransferase [candidate division KSB1 bacterium]MDZ7276558.1 nicotinate phosphoribosyltransferase [candidate division KSB1 bacterium]MDZ7285023.1 nicotinate phosphoribosyltransferase [candidate division KSB1 bacterium]MDZ7298055.1 nicotinate phosphoribosyltransferase [candidate division KSB1 bacterium]MDZ7307443.1 nicotinate phosphoribosyltransferase [candidate division KSB1 bacterium]
MFHLASAEDILSGQVTDVYFQRTRQMLTELGRDAHVAVEFILKKFPRPNNWGIFAGLEEAMTILRRLPVSVDGLPEGSLFFEDEPVLTIEGRYLDFGPFETALLGLLSQATGVATRAARCKKAAAGRPVISFGARRMHPAIAPMIERNAFIGGCDGVASVAAANLLNIKPSGTIPHAFILLVGDTVAAAQAFDRYIEPDVPRAILIDTFNDEKFEALRVAEALGDRLTYIRLDTPSNRRGDFVSLAREIRWELDLRGYQHVKIFLSGGIDEEKILQYNVIADAYGVGTAISNAPVMDFAMDIVEIDGKPVAKRGKKSGRKHLWRNRTTGERIVQPVAHEVNGDMEPLFIQMMRNGNVLYQPQPPTVIRKYVLQQLQQVELSGM